MAGKPVVKGTRIPVYLILDIYKDGADREEILEAYPDLEKEDITACLEYASERVQREGLEGEKSPA